MCNTLIRNAHKSMIIQRAGDTALKTEFVTSSKFTYCKIRSCTYTALVSIVLMFGGHNGPLKNSECANSKTVKK